MITQSEVAEAMLAQLSETRTYCSVNFGVAVLDPFERIRFALGLLAGLPDPERYIVEESFDRMFSEISPTDMMSFLTAHSAPEKTQ